MRKRILPILISTVITILLLFFLFTKVQISDILTSVSSLPAIIVISAFILYIIVHLFRALRFWIFLGKVISIDKLFTITTIHNALVNLLPFRTGELSYIYFVKKESKADIGTGLGTLVLARLFDLFAISLLFFLAIILVPELPRFAQTARVVIATIVGILALKLSFLVLFSKQVIKFWASFFKKMGIHTSKFSIWLIKKMEETTHTLHVIKSWKLVIGALACSIVIWLAQFIIAYLVFIGIGIDTTFFAVVLAASIASLLSVLPIQGFVGFGTTEAYWTVALVGVGISASEAIQAGFAIHLITIVYFLILGLYGLIRLNLAKRTAL